MKILSSKNPRIKTTRRKLHVFLQLTYINIYIFTYIHKWRKCSDDTFVKNLQPKVISTSLPGKGVKLLWKDKHNGKSAFSLHFTWSFIPGFYNYILNVFILHNFWRNVNKCVYRYLKYHHSKHHTYYNLFVLLFHISQ